MATALCLILFAGCQNPPEVDTKPNIILLTDDQRADALEVAGTPVLETPNIDRLATESVRFTETHVVAPVCMPSRTSFMSGQYERARQVGFSSANDLSETQWD